MAFPEGPKSLLEFPAGFPLLEVGEGGLDFVFGFVFVGEEEEGALFSRIGIEHVFEESGGLAFGQAVDGFEGGFLAAKVGPVFVGKGVEESGFGSDAFGLFLDLFSCGDFELFKFFVGEFGELFREAFEEGVGSALKFVSRVGSGLDDEVGNEAVFFAGGSAPDDIAELLLGPHFNVERLADEVVDHEHGSTVFRGVLGDAVFSPECGVVDFEFVSAEESFSGFHGEDFFLERLLIFWDRFELESFLEFAGGGDSLFGSEVAVDQGFDVPVAEEFFTSVGFDIVESDFAKNRKLFGRGELYFFSGEVFVVATESPCIALGEVLKGTNVGFLNSFETFFGDAWVLQSG